MINCFATRIGGADAATDIFIMDVPRFLLYGGTFLGIIVILLLIITFYNKKN